MSNPHVPVARAPLNSARLLSQLSALSLVAEKDIAQRQVNAQKECDRQRVNNFLERAGQRLKICEAQLDRINSECAVFTTWVENIRGDIEFAQDCDLEQLKSIQKRIDEEWREYPPPMPPIPF